MPFFLRGQVNYFDKFDGDRAIRQDRRLYENFQNVNRLNYRKETSRKATA